MRDTRILTTARLVLRPPRADDAGGIFHGYAQDPGVTRYMVWRPHRSIADAEAFLHTCEAGWKAGDDLTWAITERGTDALIGMVGCRLRGHKSDIGYVLARPYWNRGITTEAAGAVAAWALAQPGIVRVWAVCDVDNPASARVMEKIGMQREGVLRRWCIHPQVSPEPRDALVYARIRTEASG